MLAQKMESGKVLRRKLPKKTWKIFALNEIENVCVEMEVEKRS